MFQNVWDIDYSDDLAYIKQAIEYQMVNGVMGMKFSYNQFLYFLEKARRLLAPLDGELNDAEIVEVFFPQTKYIHLQRRDKVKQAISYAKAWQNGIWYESADESDDYKEYLLPAVYDREHIECCFDSVVAMDFGWQNYLEKNGLNALSIWYEDLADDYDAWMRNVYEFLGLRGVEIIPPPLKVLSNEQSQEWEEKFRAETSWLNDRNLRMALETGDLGSLVAERYQSNSMSRAKQRWQKMPAKRFKKLREFIFRVKRKIRVIFRKLFR